MAGPGPAIHALLLFSSATKDMDARTRSGHDGALFGLIDPDNKKQGGLS
jgi:hypothetical protein